MKKAVPSSGKSGTIRVGIGGWTFESWRGVFFPEDLPKTKELEYASQHLTTIEINGTYYRTQSPATFRKWASETPDGFVFSVKALRYTTAKKMLADAGESVSKFLASGVVEMGPKLGPILWQFAPTKKFDRDDFGAFLNLLPEKQDGVRLRHVLEVRHETFCDATFIDLAREHNAAIVFAHAEDFPAIGDVTADFAYARLQGTKEVIKAGYTTKELKKWADVARTWADGKAPDLPKFSEELAAVTPRDVFIYMISGAKVRAPAAAMALQLLVEKSRT